MAEFSGMQLTDAGRNLMAQLIAESKPLYITKVVLANGNLPDGADQSIMTNLVNPVMELPITSKTVDQTGVAKINALISNETLSEGFFATEVGIYGKHDESIPDNEAILYSYSYAGSKSDYIPAAGGANVVSYNLTTMIVIDKVSDIVAKIDTNLAFATEEELQDHINNTTMHIQRASQTASPSSLWAQEDSDGKAHPLSIDNARTAILGDSASTIPVLTGRVSQLEIEVGNIGLKMLAENACPDSNLFLYEDFVNTSKIDTFSTNVTAATSGSNAIDVDSIAGLYTGSWYWITDGIRQEAFQVKSCVKNDTIYRILAVNNLINTYNVSSTKIYRTTVDINDGVVYGSGDRKGFTWQLGTSFSGEHAAAQSTVMLNSTIDKTDSYTLTGDTKFNSDGFMTLDTTTVHNHSYGIALVTKGGGAGVWQQVDGGGNNL